MRAGSVIFRAAWGVVLAVLPFSVLAKECRKPWPELRAFESRHVQPDGRVVDFSSPEQITTSEGQSYAMFFALVNNDQTRFKQVLDWTERNLAMGGLAVSLPSWKWGRINGNQFGLLDSNSASDSDLWIAYNLLEAGRLWKNKEYEDKGRALMKLIQQQEVASLPGYGDMILPGPRGFNPSPDVYRMNPSYLPPFLLRRLAQADASDFWQRQTEASINLIKDSSPKGFVPDWITVTKAGLIPDIEKGRVGSYDAIRVYLWFAMTSPEDPLRPKMKQAVYGYMQLAERLGEPLERVDVQNGIWEGHPAPGFFYALEPLAVEFKSSRLLKALRDRQGALKQEKLASLTYYDWVLYLYAKGWMDKRYRFDKRGALQVYWTKSC